MKINKKIIKKAIVKYRFPILVIILALLSACISLYFSYGFFISSQSNTIISGKVGTSIASGGDIGILIYVEDRNSDGAGLGTYTVENNVPLYGYAYNENLSSCKTGTLNFDEKSMTYTITATKKDTCKIYFTSVASTDINLVIYKQKRNSNGALITGYEETDNVPLYGYTINETKSICDNGGTYKFDSATGKYNVITKGRTNCSFYFDGLSDSDISLNVFESVSSVCAGTNYNQIDYVPLYRTFNTSKSNCTNGTITFDGEKINIVANGKTICNAYFD